MPIVPAPDVHEQHREAAFIIKCVPDYALAIK